MPTLKFAIKGIEFQYIGEQHEITNFINTFLGQTMLPEHKELNVVRKTRLTTKDSEQGMIDLPLPQDADIIRYITSKDQYGYDLLEIQKHFFGKTFSSRGNGKRMYHRTARQLREIREAIEKQYKGKFEEVPSGKRNLKRFVFKPIQTAELAQ